MTEYKWCHKASGEFTACLSLFDLLSICGVLSICLWLMKQLKRFNYLSLLNGKSYQNGLRVPSQTLKGFGGTLNCMCWALGVSCPLCTEVFFNCSPLGPHAFISLPGNALQFWNFACLLVSFAEKSSKIRIQSYLSEKCAGVVLWGRS